jgi:D-Tyr-tRNAtyr deacylase
MRALVQRVSEAWVTSAPEDGGPHEPVGRIGAGLVVLLGVTHSDDEATASRKIRITAAYLDILIHRRIWNFRHRPRRLV